MATQEQIYDALKKAHAAGDTENATKLANYIRSSQQAFAPTTRKEGTAGIGEAFMGGLKGLASSSLTALQAPFIGGEDAALKGIERGEQMTERPGASLDAVKQAYKKDGIFSATGEALSQIPGALAEQSPFIGAMFAGARAGAVAGPYGALAGSLLAPFLMSSGAAMERKATEQLSKGKKVDINELGAYGTGLASAGMERVALGLSGVSKMLGINILQPVTRSAEQIARQNLAATLAKGGGKLIAAEVPTEIAQQMLERYYADLPLLDEEAKKEYAEAGFGATLLAPLGMAGSFKERRGAQKEVQTQEDDLNRILTEKKQTEEAEIKAREEREEITKKQADAERQQAELIRQQEKEIINAALKEAEETGQPLKPVQELINDLTNLGQTNPKTGLPLRKNRPLSKKELEQKKADFKAALAAPSGQFTSGSSDIDPETGQPTFVERELTEAEVRGVPIVKGYPFPPKPKPIDFDAPITKALYKTFGVGFTANVIKETEGLDPLVLEDNVKIRTAIAKHLKKVEDDAPPSVKLREYLETIPSLEQLENEQETRLARDYDERTGGSASLLGESADPDAAVFQQDDGGATLEPPGYLGEYQREQDAIDAALIEEENAKNLAAAEKKLSKETNLLTTLRKQGVNRNELSEITGENKLQRSGYPTGAIFKVGAPLLVDSLNDGVFDAYLPPDLQMGINPIDTYEQLSEKTDKAYEYITNLIRSGAVNVKPFEAQQEVDLLSAQVAQMEGSPVFYKTDAATGKPTNENTPIPQTLIDAHKEKTSDPTSYYREIEKYIGPNFKDKTLSDLENILDERVRSLPQDLRYVVSGNIKGTDVETVWQEGIVSKQKAEEVAKNLEQQGKATNTRVEEYDLKIGPMGITKQAQPAAAPTKKVRPIIKDALKVDELLIQFEEIDVADNYQGLGDSYNNAESLEQAINQNPAYTDEYIIKQAEYHLDKAVNNLPEYLTGDKESDAIFRREIKQLKKFLKKYKDVKPTQEAQPAAEAVPAEAVEYVIFGKSPKNPDKEDLLMSEIPGKKGEKITSEKEAKKIEKILKDKYGATETRITKIDLSTPPDFINTIQESRDDTEGVVPTGQTAATITTELVEEFGNNINKAIQKGMLVIVDDVSQLPSNVTMSLKKDGVIPPNGAFDKDSGITYLIANRIGQGRARRVLLHEIGEHYGLEGMLGKDYEPTLNRLNKLKDTDETVGGIWESVTRQYPDLTVGSKPFLQEVMAKIGEDAPNNSIFKRVVSLVKEFLRKLGFINVNSLTKADLQDMVLNSLNVSLADIRSTSRTTTGTLALQMSKEEGPGAFEAAQEAATRLLGLPPNNTALDRARAMGFDVDNILYHGTSVVNMDAFKLNAMRERDLAKLGKAYEGRYYSTNEGIYLTNNELVADYFASSKVMSAFDSGLTKDKIRKTVLPLFVKGKIFDFKNPEHLERFKQPYQNNKELRDGLPGTTKISEKDLDGIAKGLHSDIEANHTAISRLGFDGAKMFEPKEFLEGQELNTDAMTTVVYDPVNIRSVDAAFNPESATSPNLQFSIPDGYDSTAIFAPPNNANSKTFFNKFIDTFESFKNTPKDSLLGLFEKGGSAYTSTRINLAGTASGVEEKLGKEWTGAIEDGITENVRADIVLNQALASDTMAAQSAEEGAVILLPNGLAKVEKSEYNINRVLSIRDEIGKQSTPEVARHVTQAYLIARRYELVLKLIEKKRNNLETLKENIKKEKSIVKTSTKDDKKEAQKRLTRYEKQLARDVHFIESRTKRDAEGKVMWIAVSPEQQNAIAPGLALAQQHPQLIEMGEVIDGINENRINLMESSGIYSKDLADYYREQKGYVPLFRNMNEELTELDNANPGVKSHFNGFADVGKEYGFTGSEKVVDDVIGNILKQHFFSVNAAVRNNANRVTGEMVGVRDQDGEGEVVYSVKKPEGAAGNVSAPVFIDGERLFVEYPDPNIAVAIQGALPVYDGILGFFGKFSKIFRLGITSNPIFQTYQVANDAIGASLYSGVRNPLDLSKRIIAGFYKNQSYTGGNTDAIDAQMKRLGIAGGFGSTSEEIQRTASRKLGVENATKIERLYESVDKFASKSDIAQRRGIFEQTLIETGGTLQADGSIVGGNEVLAMNRALNIINWQKRGAATWVRKLTHVVPFLNAYLQGMDVLINALRGKGLTGGDAKLARALLYRNAASLLMLNLLYSLAVSGSDDYEEQDDRIKFRNYIIPGTGFKLPIRAELSLLVKYIPEQTALMISQYGREGAIDMAKVSDATLTAIADAGLSPNIFPQLIRGTVEGVTNYNFYTDRPLVGTGLSRLATEEQYTEGTSELAKLIGQSGLMSPIKFDHIFKAYTGTIGATGLYAIDQVSNVFLDNKRPSPTLKNFPILSPLIYNEQGRDAINDFYDLKEESDEVAATLNRLLKFNPEKAREYRADNRKLIGARKQINKLTTRLRDIRNTRKRILASNISASDKRSRIERLDKQAHNVARNISKIRIRVNEDL